MTPRASSEQYPAEPALAEGTAAGRAPAERPGKSAAPEPVLLQDATLVAVACARLAAHPVVTVDTEFQRETTYYPKLCLIQLASPDEAFAIDPLAPGMDLAPFYALMRDERVLKVFHAARQDLEIVWHGGGLIPSPLFDTQVAAMVCGYGDQVSYEQLAGSLAGAAIDKSNRFTDWTRRPLTRAQLDYAIADVTHLRVVHAKLAERLERTGRSSWLAEEMAVLTSPDTYRGDPERAWERVKARVRKPRDLAVLMELAAWREREAQARDQPRGHVMKDDALAEVVLAAPRDAADLARLRALPRGFDRSRGAAALLEAVARGLERDVATLPVTPERRGGNGGSGATSALLKVLLQAVCERHHVASKLVAGSDDLDAIAADDAADVPALRGWRAELFGRPALALKAGRVALAVERGRVVVRAVVGEGVDAG